MGRKPILSEEEITQAYELYQTGLSLLEVSYKLYVSDNTIREAFIHRGLPIRQKKGINRKSKLSKELVKKAAELVQEGVSHELIGLQMGVSKSCVQNSLVRAGYPTRRVK